MWYSRKECDFRLVTYTTILPPFFALFDWFLQCNKSLSPRHSADIETIAFYVKSLLLQCTIICGMSNRFVFFLYSKWSLIESANNVALEGHIGTFSSGRNKCSFRDSTWDREKESFSKNCFFGNQNSYMLYISSLLGQKSYWTTG